MRRLYINTAIPGQVVNLQQLVGRGISLLSLDGCLESCQPLLLLLAIKLPLLSSKYPKASFNFVH